MIQALHGQADTWRSAELARAKRAIARGDDLDAVLQALSRGLTQKMLHGVVVELKAADGVACDHLSTTVARMFNIGDLGPISA